jgi:quercetin dioxygenase-like cupin family protein
MRHPVGMAFSLDGWNIGHADDIDWGPWGSSGDARAKVLANGDDFYLALVEAEPGYRGDPHEHAHTEFLYVVSGTLQNQGHTMTPGDAYVAAAGSTHDEFRTDDGATYVSIFKL